ncbi:hypothetical protein NMG60_11029089 [Bertholletia excelsa]
MAALSRVLEITVISGEDIREGRHLASDKKKAFVVVRTDSWNAQSTAAVAGSGGRPAWNEKLVVDMPAHAPFLTVEVQCRSSSRSGNKLIGAARIPVTDFAGGYLPENYLHFLSYRLRDARGERNGIINLSVRVKVPQNYTSPVTCASAASYSRPWTAAASYSRPWTAVPASQKPPNEVVTGIPVGYRY